jgi:hypothetical protein
LLAFVFILGKYDSWVISGALAMDISFESFPYLGGETGWSNGQKEHHTYVDFAKSE